ncbi:hypothetical protein BDY21DRAFT_353584 [Lineolata rhizophorae]|uniref:Uncharacterized protein n=1 Tax=Lineolata rhizophorae TaxID=578093 RepID=A0A6A6NRC7_9PEZI|nr:hypothetical protein BDY21DRAFT_353584 [Lineolata rhizophorae]
MAHDPSSPAAQCPLPSASLAPHLTSPAGPPSSLLPTRDGQWAPPSALPDLTSHSSPAALLEKRSKPRTVPPRARCQAVRLT